ncbi:MAG: hypothetical protein HYX92_17005 [Chloroflexi bacterium]|nr:hypothetical protein [Chloroflexota bacterium]
MKRLVLLAPLMILLSVLPSPLAFAQAGPGQMTGRLLNKSREGGNVAGIPVKLNSYSKTTLQGSLDDKTDGEGKFTFSGLVTEKTYSYQVTLTYQGADYYSDVVWFEEGQSSKSLEIAVYNPTGSDETIKVAASHTIIYVSKEGLLVKEFYLFRNEGDKAFVGKEIGGKKETLRFSVPPGATGLQLGQGLSEGRIAKTDYGFVSNATVVPGDTLVGYSYTLRGSGDYRLARSIAYPVDNVNVLIEDKGVVASSPQLGLQDPIVMKEGRFLLLAGKDFARAAAHEISLRVNPEAGQSSTPGALPVAAAGVAAILSVGAIYLLVRRKEPRLAAGPAAPVETPASERERLLEEVARLDDEFEAGALSEEDYRRVRAQKKAELLRLTGRSLSLESLNQVQGQGQGGPDGVGGSD